MQRTLVFSREERLALIEAAQLTPHVSRTMELRLKGLLLQLELTSGREGCFPGQDLLAEKMGTTRFSVIRWLKLARELRLVTTSPRKTWAGRRQLDYTVDWSGLRRFCPPAALAEIAQQVDEKCNSAPKNATARCCALQQRVVAPCNSAWSSNSSYKPPEGEEVLRLIAEVSACGVDLADKAVHAALGRGCTAAEIRGAIGHYRTLAPAGVKPGALFVKLRTMAPGEAAYRRFPRPAANRSQAAQVRTLFREMAAREAETAAREAAEREALESVYGSQLDALTQDELERLVEQTGSSGLLYQFRRKPDSAIVRAELLRRLANQQSHHPDWQTAKEAAT